MDKNKLKLFDPKKSKVKDPVRYPKIINPIEDKVKIEFEHTIKNMIKSLTKEMVEVKK